MKKTMSAFLLVMILFAAASGVLAEDIDFTGVWYGSISEMIPVEMTFHVDGTSTTDMMGDVFGGTWEFDGENIITDKGTEFEDILYYNPDDETLRSSYGDMELVLSREVEDTYVLPEARVDVEVDEFSGEWDCRMVEMFDVLLPPMLAEIDLDLSISGTDVLMTFYLLDMPSESELEAVFNEGRMVVYDENGKEELALQLHEDGMMSALLMMKVDTEILPVTFIMEPMISEDEAS